MGHGPLALPVEAAWLEGVGKLGIMQGVMALAPHVSRACMLGLALHDPFDEEWVCQEGEMRCTSHESAISMSDLHRVCSIENPLHPGG